MKEINFMLNNDARKIVWLTGYVFRIMEFQPAK